MKNIIDKIKQKQGQRKIKKELDTYRCTDIYRYHCKITTSTSDTYEVGEKYKHTDLDFNQWINNILSNTTIKTDNECLVCSSNIIDIKLIAIDEIKDFYFSYYGDARDLSIDYFSDNFIEEQTNEYKKLKALYEMGKIN